MKAGVLLSGCGVYDGSEIHESVFTLLALDEAGVEIDCIAPDVAQHHVVNHTNGEDMDETRNVLVESARIARGAIRPLAEAKAADFDLLVLPGGFGAAKNWSQWAFSGPEGAILPDVKRLIREVVQAGKPLVALCMGPTTVAKALEGTEVQATLTVGSTQVPSPYDIGGISQGMEAVGATAVMKTIEEIAVDEANKIVTAPCYMLEARVSQIRQNVKMAIEAGLKLV